MTGRSAVFLCLFALPTNAPAQVPSSGPDRSGRFQNVQTIQALLHNAIIGIAQDHHGYIWIVGHTRLYRYDGFQFQSFSNTPADTLLQRWMYRGLAGGRHGILCLYGSGNEVVLYDIDSASARLYRLAGEQRPDAGPVNTTCAIEDASGRFIVGTQEGMICRIDPRTATIETLFGQTGGREPTGDRPVRALAEDFRGNIWAGGESGIFFVTGGAGDAVSFPPDSVSAMYAGSNGKIWVATLRGEFGVIDPDRRSYIPRGHSTSSGPRNLVRSLVEDPSGKLWIGTDDGLDQWEPEDGMVRSLLSKDVHLPGSETAIKVLFVDRSGLLWIGTLSRSLITYAPWRHKFQSCTPAGGDLSGLSGAFVTSVLADRRGTLWVGTRQGLNYLPHDSRRFRQLYHVPGDSQSLTSSYIISICQRRSGDLWIGTLNGISVLKPHASAFVQMRHSAWQPSSLGADTVNGIFEDKDGTVWVGHLRGVDRYEDRTGKFSAFLRWPIETMGLTGSAGNFYRDSRDNFWIVTAGRGLLRIGPTPGDSVWYRREPGREGSLPSNFLDCLREDEKGNLWVGSYAGLARFDYSSGAFHTYSLRAPTADIDRLSRPASYLPLEPGVAAIVPDQKGNLWLSTSSGLARFNIATGVGHQFGDIDGTVIREGMRHAMISTADGWIYCGGVGGLTWFRPDSLMENAVAPLIAIADFQISGNPITPPPIGTAGISLKYGQNAFSFKFAALDYSDPARNQFMYMLEGADDRWVLAGNNPGVTYVSVEPGSYTLRVRASNSDGVWNMKGLSLPIVIERPYWQTWWFRGLILILLGALAYGAYRYRLAKILALERLRLRIADDLHDDIGSELSGLALESDLLARRLPEGDPGRERLRAVGSMIRSSADNLRDVVWIVSPDQDKVQDLVERMREVAAKMLSGLPYEFRFTGSDRSDALDIEFKRHILMMFKEILHNVARHARASRVEVEFALRNGHLQLRVQDDGVGFDVSGKHAGHGLRSLHTRAGAIRGTVSIESAPGRGTAVCLDADITRL